MADMYPESWLTNNMQLSLEGKSVVDANNLVTLDGEHGAIAGDFLFLPQAGLTCANASSNRIMGDQNNDKRLNVNLFRINKFFNIVSATLIVGVKGAAGTSGYLGIYSLTGTSPSPGPSSTSPATGDLLTEFKFDISSTGGKVVAPSVPLVLRPDTLYYCAMGTDETVATAQANGTTYDDSFMNLIGFLAVNPIAGGHLPPTLGGRQAVYNQSCPTLLLIGQ